MAISLATQNGILGVHILKGVEEACDWMDVRSTENSVRKNYIPYDDILGHISVLDHNTLWRIYIKIFKDRGGWLKQAIDKVGFIDFIKDLQRQISKMQLDKNISLADRLKLKKEKTILGDISVPIVNKIGVDKKFWRFFRDEQPYEKKKEVKK